jgi:hypothetical protein
VVEKLNLVAQRSDCQLIEASPEKRRELTEAFEYVIKPDFGKFSPYDESWAFHDLAGYDIVVDR